MLRKPRNLARIASAVCFFWTLGLVACGGGGGSPPPPRQTPTPTASATPHGTPSPRLTPTPSPTPTATATQTPTPTPTASYSPSGDIKHVVVVIQENRSVDNLFNGFPGANTAQYGYWHAQQITLTPFDLAEPYTADHTHSAWHTAWDGGAMDGFGDVPGGNFGGGRRSAAGPKAYVYVPQSEVQPYWDLAAEYAFRTRRSNRIRDPVSSATCS